MEGAEDAFYGQAIFLDTMGRYAKRRFDELDDDTSIEALLREFGTEDEYLGFMHFRLEEAFL